MPDNAPINFQGKDPREHFQFYFRQHWARLIPQLSKTLITSIAIVVLGWLTIGSIGIEDAALRRSLLVILCTIFAVTNLTMMWRLYRHFLKVFIVTDKKVHCIEKTLLFVDDHQSIDIWMLQDIDKNQHGLLQNVLHYGTVTLEAQDSTVRIHFVPRVRERHNELLRLKEVSRFAASRTGVMSGMQKHTTPQPVSY